MTLGPVLVLYVPAGGGHRAAALAIQEAGASLGLDVEMLDALEFAPPLFAKAYVGAHLFGSARTPTLYGAAFDASNRPDPLRDKVRAAIDYAIGDRLVTYVRERRPAAVVCTHFYPLFELGRLRLSGELDAPLAAVVTDYVAHAVWSTPGVDLFFTAEGRAEADVRARGATGVVATGIPVRPAFGRAPAWAPPDKGEPLRVLVTSGGFGVGPVLDVLRSFIGVPDVSIDVVCGNRPELVRRARRFAARKGLDAVVVGFADDMPDRVARAHVVVGKPGGLTMSECLAAGRPFVSVGAVPGQEAVNERTLLAWHAGVKAIPRAVGPRIEKLRDTGALDALARSSRAHGRPNAAVDLLRALPLATPRTQAALANRLPWRFSGFATPKKSPATPREGGMRWRLRH